MPRDGAALVEPARVNVRRQRVSRVRGFRHWKWHLDEMYVKLNGEMVYLWRAVDHEGEVLESYITQTRDKAAALAFMKKTGVVKDWKPQDAQSERRFRVWFAIVLALSIYGSAMALWSWAR